MKKFTLVLILILLSVFCHLSFPHAAVPHLIGYQGRLTDADGNPKEGSFQITFRIYDAIAAGNLLWQEIHTDVTVTDGIFDVLLGSITALNLPFDTQYYLAIQVASDPEMTPRQQIASVGYAYKSEKAESADDADTVHGIHASATPEPNKLLSLDSSGKFPSSAMGLKVYDSGWFFVQNGRKEYTFEHNLDTQKVLWKLYFSTDTTGSNIDEVIIAHPGFGTHHRGGQLINITATHITVITAEHCVHDKYNYGIYSSGYYRILGLAL